MQEIWIISMDDLHVHSREPKDLERGTLFHTVKMCDRGLFMPNLRPPILTAADALAYKAAIEHAAASLGFRGFVPLMTIQIVDGTTPETVRAAREAGVIAGKVYPLGVTTNSHNGVREIGALGPVFEEMQRVGLALCLHGEVPDAECLDRERLFLKTLVDLAYGFPRLRIVLEHLSTADAVSTVEALPENVAATITAHHLRLTLDDVIGDTLRPHHFCKPIPKRARDRQALIAAATGGNPKFFFGSDSAPHTRDKKECASGCAGVFSAPVALPLLATIFEEQGRLDALEAFVSIHGARFYGLPINTGRTRLVRKAWRVPTDPSYDLVSFLSGETLPWRFAYPNETF